MTNTTIKSINRKSISTIALFLTVLIMPSIIVALAKATGLDILLVFTEPLAAIAAFLFLVVRACLSARLTKLAIANLVFWALLTYLVMHIRFC